MSERDVTVLLDRLAAATPAMDVSVPGVVGTGRRRVRRRRAAASGMTLGGLALAATLWLGPGQDEWLGTQSVSPAGVSWEVDRPTTVTISEGPPISADLLTVEKSDAGTTALIGLDGTAPEEVSAQRGPGGVDVFVGTNGTLVVWDHPDGVTGVRVLPEPTASSVGVTDEGLGWLVAREPGYRPTDLVLNDDRQVWTAAGEHADTALLEDDGVRLTAFALPAVDLVGYVDRAGTISTVDTLSITAGEEFLAVARLPREAVFAREVLRDEPSGEPVRVSEPRLTALVGEWSMVLITGTDVYGGGADRSPGDEYFDVEWSSDGLTWHPQPTDLDQPTSPRPDGARGAGEEVSILGETYRVAVDPHGWPQLLRGDGSVFLTVSDGDGPPSGSGGGIVMWRAHWWPWSDRHEVHFAVDGRPVLAPGQEGQDALTITGPAGEVGLVAVPAGS